MTARLLPVQNDYSLCTRRNRLVCGLAAATNTACYRLPMVYLTPLREGMTGSARILVGEEHTAPRVGSGRVRVLATPVMINLMEAAALDAVEAFLPAGHQSLGIKLDVSHHAATPVGMRIFATARLVGVDGRR